MMFAYVPLLTREWAAHSTCQMSPRDTWNSQRIPGKRCLNRIDPGMETAQTDSKATAYVPDDQIDFQERKRFLSVPTASCTMRTGILSPEIKRAEREVGHSPPFDSESKNA
jgi:hypothetical protein